LIAIFEENIMFEGKLVGIYIGEQKCEELRSIDNVRAVEGKGLEGDRYFLQQGTFTKPDIPALEVTLIEIEAIEALAREKDLTLNPGQARRNLVTQDVPLNHLVGKDFQIGEVVLRGLALCEPCSHLQSLTAEAILDGLRHRGGLRAQVLKGGVLRTGDSIRAVASGGSEG
jgi:MOSC domain-containing protein YiiM